MTSLETPIIDKTERTEVPSLTQAFHVWLKIGLLSFGGPAGQIALMHKMLVEERRWIDESRFLHALNYCMLLPGPEAQQLATYIGWLLHRTVGGLIAGLLFVLPGAAVMLALSIAYALYADLPLVAAAFIGVKAAVLIVVVEAVLRIGKRALKTAPMYLIAAGAFVAIALFAVPFPLIVAGAALVGFIGGMARPDLFVVIKGQSVEDSDGPSVIDTMAARGELSHTAPSASRSIWLIVIFGLLWAGPVAALFATLGAGNVFAEEAAFFSKLAVVTFGGAYAVLAYMAQQAVETHQWLTGAEMLDGLGLAETTPGPLIMVTQFVGFLGAYRHATGIDPILAGVIGSVVTVWVTFAPCFLWIFLGAPYIERLRNNRSLSAALSGITAAVVGVILNLAVWFGLRVVFAEVGSVQFGMLSLPAPDVATISYAALGLTVVAALAMFRFHLDVLKTLALCGTGAIAIHFLT
ncbi:MAG: chromate efflux transporter [Alphaproteobacteria bacterium]|nr:chromate efflux transporter [Alphaproteobacteria bacterium]